MVTIPNEEWYTRLKDKVKEVDPDVEKKYCSSIFKKEIKKLTKSTYSGPKLADA